MENFSWFEAQPDPVTPPPPASGIGVPPAGSPAWDAQGQQFDFNDDSALAKASAFGRVNFQNPNLAPSLNASPPTSAPSPEGAFSWQEAAGGNQAPQAGTPSAPATEPSVGNAMAQNFLTGLARLPGAVASSPAALGHATNWLAKGAVNLFDGTHWTADQLDATNPVTREVGTWPGRVDKTVFGVLDAADKALAPGGGFTPYQPTTLAGQAGQAAVTAGASALFDPAADLGAASKAWTAFKAATAGGAAELTSRYTDNPFLSAITAFLAHASTAAAGTAAREATIRGREYVTPVFSSKAGGEINAGRNLTNAAVDPDLPGPANPSAAELTDANTATHTATSAIPTGSPAWIAGDTTRAGLQGRADALTAARSRSVDGAYEDFRAQPPLPIDKLAPFAASPSFKGAVKAANNAVLDEGGRPLTDYWDFDPEGNPTPVPNAAVPPDVLNRIKMELDGNAASAKTNTARRTATTLQRRFVDFLDSHYPSTYPRARGLFADGSRPLDPFEAGPVAKTLAAPPAYGGTPQYTLPSERVPDLFLRSPAAKSNVDQLIAAYGGDKDAALQGLNDHLAGVAQTAINPDGTFDAAAFDKAVQPYNKALNGSIGMFFPELAARFSSAKAAQATLDRLTTQASLAGDLKSGGLRDASGIVTGKSIGTWVRKNDKALTSSQDPAVTLRLHALANALGTDPAAGLETALNETLPTMAGAATGGLEGGVLGTLQHNFAAGLSKGQLGRFREAYSREIERAVLDPEYAQSLIDAYARRPKGVSGTAALLQAMIKGGKQAARTAPVAGTISFNAGQSTAEQ